MSPVATRRASAAPKGAARAQKAARPFTVIISDRVDHVITVEAATADEAGNQAGLMFELGERDVHFTERCETSIDVAEVHP